MRTKPVLLALVLIAGMIGAGSCGGAKRVAGTTGEHASVTAESRPAEPEVTGGETGSTEEAVGESAGKGTVIEVDVKSGKLEFEKTAIEVPAGTVTLRSENPDGLEHNIAVKGPGVDEQGELVANGDISEVTVTLKAGQTYEFYCAPHEAAGMKGAITVT